MTRLPSTPNITNTRKAKKRAGEGNTVDPLEAGPADPEIRRGTEEEEGGSKKKLSEGGTGRQGGGEAGKGEQST